MSLTCPRGIPNIAKMEINFYNNWSILMRSGDFDPFLIKGLKYPVRNKSH